MYILRADRVFSRDEYISLGEVEIRNMLLVNDKRVIKLVRLFGER